MRFAWCDTHGMLRGKTLTAAAAIRALRTGVGMVGTLMLKDSSDHTAYQVFEPGIGDELPGFACAGNLLLLPDPASLRVLPWAHKTGWLQCQPVFANGTPVPLDTRRQLQLALATLARAGWGMVCGLEVESTRRQTSSSSSGASTSAGYEGAPPFMSRTIRIMVFESAADTRGTVIDARAGQSLMKAAIAAGIEGIAADCGGTLTCATCHVMVRAPWQGHLPAMTEDEDSMLDYAACTRQSDSRLACQIALTDDLDGMQVDLPASQY